MRSLFAISSRTALLGLFAVLALSTALVAQPPGLPPGDPPPVDPPAGPIGPPPALACGVVEGTQAITSATEDAIEGTLSGDLEGSFVWMVEESETHTAGPFTVTVTTFVGSLAVGGGVIATEGNFIQVAFGNVGFVLARQLITGGEKAFAGAAGFLFSFGSPADPDIAYVGVVCTPADEEGSD